MIQYRRLQIPILETNPVLSVWSISTGPQTHVIDFVPDGFTDIIVPVTGQFSVLTAAGSRCCLKASLVGQFDKSMKIKLSPHTKVIGIKLKPYLLGALIGNSARDTFNVMTPLADIPGYVLGIHPDEYSRIKETHSLDEISELLGLFHMSVWNNNAVVQKINETILWHTGIIRIKDIASQLGCSQRYIENKFQEHVGLSPKQYARIIRVKKASLLLADTSNKYIGDIAGELNYFDASHFCKDFSRITSVSPREFKEQTQKSALMNEKVYTDQWVYS